MTTASKNKILAIFVLYKIRIEDCISFKTFIQFYKANSSLNIDILIINNSENEIILENNKTTYNVINANNYQKLAGAYNIGLEYATKLGFSWVLLIDQDTEFTQDYFTMLTHFLTSEKDCDLVAVVPFLKENSNILSPQKISNLGWWQHKNVTQGYQTGRITAFNSLSLLDVEFMLSLGGFNLEYPLDMLDHWYYLQIYNRKKKVYVLDTYIEHQLSLSSYENNVSFERHKSILKAEKGFTKELGNTHYFTYKIRLTLRLIRQFLFFKDKRYALIIFKTIFNKP